MRNFIKTKSILKIASIICIICLLSLFAFHSFAKVTVNVSQFQMGAMFKAITHFKALGVEVNKFPTMSDGIYNWVVDKYAGYNGKVGNYTNVFRTSDNNGKQAQNIFEIGVKGYLKPPAAKPDIPYDQTNYFLTIVILSELDDTADNSFTANIVTPSNAMFYLLNANGETFDSGIEMDLIGQKQSSSTVASVYSVSLSGSSMLVNLLSYGACFSLYYGFTVPYSSYVSTLNWNFMRPIINVSYDAETSEAIGSATYDLINNNIAPSLSNIESSAQSIIESQYALKESIDKQPENIANAIEQKEQAAAADAQNKTDEIIESMKDESFVPYDSLFNSLTSLVTACGSTERATSITFPELKIPAIGNNSAMVISEQKTIDLQEALNNIPAVFLVGLRLVASAFLYYSIVVYCMRNIQGFFVNGGDGLDE